MDDDRAFAEVFSDSSALVAAFVTAMPDGLLYQSWLRQEREWPQDEVAALFGDLVRASREMLGAMSSERGEIRITVESHDLLVVVREINGDFACGLVFPSETALGLVRLDVRRMVGRMQELLAS